MRLNTGRKPRLRNVCTQNTTANGASNTLRATVNTQQIPIQIPHPYIVQQTCSQTRYAYLCAIKPVHSTQDSERAAHELCNVTGMYCRAGKFPSPISNAGATTYVQHHGKHSLRTIEHTLHYTMCQSFYRSHRDVTRLHNMETIHLHSL
jgi:hypothetical protein